MMQDVIVAMRDNGVNGKKALELVKEANKNKPKEKSGSKRKSTESADGAPKRKRPMSSYMLFNNAKRAEAKEMLIKEETCAKPDKPSIGEIAKKVGCLARTAAGGYNIDPFVYGKWRRRRAQLSCVHPMPRPHRARCGQS